MKVIRRLLIILSVLILGFITLVFSNSDLLNAGVVAIVIAVILKQMGIYLGKSDSEYDGDDDTDWDGDEDD